MYLYTPAMCQMRDIDSTSRGNPLVPNRRNLVRHTQLGLPDKGCAIKLVVCYLIWLWSMIYGMNLWTSARCVGLVPRCGQDGYLAQIPKHPINTYLHITYTYHNLFWIGEPTFWVASLFMILYTMFAMDRNILTWLNLTSDLIFEDV